MVKKDIHAEPFDDTTISKLLIFENYAKEWIPTFIYLKVERICIFDFFAGTGFDKNHVSGSPIRILDSLKQYIADILKCDVTVDLFLNEFKPQKFTLLKDAIESYLSNEPTLASLVNVHYFNEDFDVLYDQLYPLIRDYPSLVFLDQNGIKYIRAKYLLSLEETTQTDFLYFISSSAFKRFKDTKEFTDIIDVDIAEIEKSPWNYIHRTLLHQLRQSLPERTDLKLYPFTLKKRGNVYGIIFGAKHPRAVEKFLNVAWSMNPINGDANFDIDDDVSKFQTDLFGGTKRTKIELFESQFEEAIMERKVTNNKEAYSFTLDAGHPTKHANAVISKLRKLNKVQIAERSLKINFKAINRGEIVEIRVQP
ncbi:MAG: three-Cys-motif partner protein TcmP [Candidatus Marinimicrobia bacterium]|nr:three-Cys-motif partner protein TcmP [Candidatus Neomarinimicrobiota bacterium]